MHPPNSTVTNHSDNQHIRAHVAHIEGPAGNSTKCKQRACKLKLVAKSFCFLRETFFESFLNQQHVEKQSMPSIFGAGGRDA